MLDILIGLALGLVLGLALNRGGMKRGYALLFSAVTGVFLGYLIFYTFPVGQTSVGMLLQINPQLRIIWENTQDISQVAKVARYVPYITPAMGACTGLLGCFIGYALTTEDESTKKKG